MILFDISTGCGNLMVRNSLKGGAHCLEKLWREVSEQFGGRPAEAALGRYENRIGARLTGAPPTISKGCSC
ncbi:hypothetical protein PH7735_03772 [Shimia thalassica]|uniref:Uncharacterized protein n=1 Tax=Shimia thalassica TaxID=1715693 RepID=A0A0P1IHE3_9RHOB|nr:hypothetical protein PH7735_03772 [Shimia thalassica]